IIKINTEIERSYGFFKKIKDGRVNYRIRIPSNLRLLAETVNGTLRAENLNSDVRLESVNGTIMVNRCSGVTDLQTVNEKIKGNFDSTKGLVQEAVMEAYIEETLGIYLQMSALLLSTER